MNSPVPADRVRDEQASLWAARLEGGTLDAAGHAALQRWLAEDPTHRALLSSYCQFSADLEVQLPVLVERGALVPPPPAKRPHARWAFPRLVLLTGAAAALAVFGFRMLRSEAAPADFTAPAGHRQAFTLGDGTRVELDAHTELQFVERGGERRAHFGEGKAFFTVSKDRARPFFVETPAGTVRVTGTVFAVDAETKSLEVTVVEGSVQVQPGTATGVRGTTSVALGAGDRLSANAGEVTVRQLSRDALEDALAWRQGIAVFVAEPLEVALARFARYHDRPIRVTPAAAKLPVSGRYGLDDLAGFLTGIEESLGVRAAKEPGNALRVSLRSE